MDSNLKLKEDMAEEVGSLAKRVLEKVLSEYPLEEAVEERFYPDGNAIPPDKLASWVLDTFCDLLYDGGTDSFPGLEVKGRYARCPSSEAIRHLEQWYGEDIYPPILATNSVVDLPNTTILFKDYASDPYTCTVAYLPAKVSGRQDPSESEMRFEPRSCALLLAAVDTLLPSLLSDAQKAMDNLKVREKTDEIMKVYSEQVLKSALPQWGYDNIEVYPGKVSVLLLVHMANGFVGRFNIRYSRFDEFFAVLRPLLDRISSPSEKFEDISFLEDLPIGKEEGEG